MPLIEKALVAKKCGEIFPDSFCSPVIESIYANTEIWIGALGLVVAIVGLLVQVTKRQRIVVDNDPLVEKLSQIAKPPVDPGIEVEVRLPSADERLQLQARFAQLEGQSEGARRPIASRSGPLHVSLIAEIEAERRFTVKRGDRKRLPSHGVREVQNGMFFFEYAVSPNFLSWSDDGQEILVSCDHHGVRRYKVDERGLTLTQDHYSAHVLYYQRLMPEWCRWSVHPNRGLSVCYLVKSPRTDVLFVQLSHDEPTPINMNSSSLRVGGLASIGNAESMLNPWRPGRQELLVMDSDGRSQRDGGARAISAVNVANAVASKALSAGLIRRYELDALIPPGHYVQSYCWHHSGQFMAVEVGPDYGAVSRRVWVIEYGEGRVLAVSSWGRSMVGWLGTSSRMLLACAAGEGRSGEERFAVWDLSKDHEQLVDPPMADSMIKSLTLGYSEIRKGRTSYCRRPNADGSLWLNVDGEHLRVYPTDGSGDALDINIEHRGAGAWSPTDPTLFAGVGEIAGKPALRLWRIGAA